MNIFAVLLCILLIAFVCRISLRKTPRSNISNPSVAVISAVYGGYDSPATHVPQSIPVDFFFFTDSDAHAPGYTIDKRKYHYEFRHENDTKALNNSYELNNHTFNQAKFYKQQFHRIPCLKKYDFIIWLDGSIELTCPYAIEKTIRAMQNSKKGVLTWKHEMRNNIKAEAKASHYHRYTSKFWNGQAQTYQDVDKQYDEYTRDHYKDDNGLYITCMVAWDMKHPKTVATLDLWFLQTLLYTTQDQISFPYVLWKMKNAVHVLPDRSISGDKPHNSTSIFNKRAHKK